MHHGYSQPGPQYQNQLDDGYNVNKMNYGDDRYQPYGSLNQQYDTRYKKQKPKRFENSEGHLQDGEVD